MVKTILILVLLICGYTSAQTTRPAFRVGRIDDPAIAESSGIVTSRQHAGVFWTHNDSGNPATLFAIDAAGKTLASFPVAARNLDWEDIAADNAGNLYIADTGNNAGKRKTVAVFQIVEPNPTTKPAAELKITQSWTLTYPAQPFDCESLFVWDKTGYLISKHRNATPAGLYRFSLGPQNAPQVLEKVLDLPTRIPVTSADLSPDGRRLAILTIAGPMLFDLKSPGDVASLAQQPSRSVFFTRPTMEAITFTAEGLLVTDEKRPMYLFRWKDFGER